MSGFEGLRARLRAEAAQVSASAGPIVGLAVYLTRLVAELGDGERPRRVVAALLAEIPDELRAVNERLIQMYGVRWADDVMEGLRLRDDLNGDGRTDGRA